MRTLTIEEQKQISGGEIECSVGSDYASCWDSDRGVSVTLAATNEMNGSTTFSAFLNHNGNTTQVSANSAEQLGKLLISTAIGATVIGMGGGAVIATAIGMAASYGYSKLWHMASDGGPPPLIAQSWN